MISLRPDFLTQISLSPEMVSAVYQIGEYKGKQQLFDKRLPEILKSLKEHAIIESSESSNRIEQIYAPREKIRAIVTQNATPENRSEQEIAGYKDALNLIHDSHSDMNFSTNIIKTLHQEMYKYRPEDGGQWKNSDNDIVEKDSMGRVTKVRFETVKTFQTSDYMEQLVEQYHVALKETTIPPLILIPLVVLDYLCIHPFGDGNGRTARLITLLLLYHQGYEVGQYISLERIFEQSKESYYDTLYKSSQNWHGGKHDPLPWMNYFWGVIISAYKEYENRTHAIKDGAGIKSEVVRIAVERMNNIFTLNDLVIECPDTSKEWIRRVLRDLKKQGYLETVGKGRGTKWRKI